MYKTNGSGKCIWSPNERISVLIFGFPNPGKEGNIVSCYAMARADQFTSGTPCAWPHNGCFFQKILYFYFYNTILTQDLSGLEYQLTHANRIPPEANHQLLLFQALLLHLKEKFLKICFNTCKRF